MHKRGEGEKHEHGMDPLIARILTIAGQQIKRCGQEPQVTLNTSQGFTFVTGEEEPIYGKKIDGKENDDGWGGRIVPEIAPFLLPIPFDHPVDKHQASHGQQRPVGKGQRGDGYQQKHVRDVKVPVV